MHAVSSTVVAELVILEIGTYNAQYRRPFETHLDGQGLQMFQQKLADAPAYAPAMLNGIANQFIMPSAQPEKQLFIPQGFGEQRLRFHMKVIHNFRMGGQVIEHLVGYTNYVGASAAGFASDCEFYVNSTVMVRESQEMTPTGLQTFSNMADNSHILVDNQWDGIYGGNNEQRMRPEDVFAAMSRNHLQGMGTNLIDGRSTMSNVAVKSSRKNSLAPMFMANVLENYRNAKQSEEFGQGEQQILGQARGYASDNNVGKDPFLSAIAGIRGAPLGNTFTWRDLERLDPNALRNTTLIQMDQAAKGDAHWAGQTADWGGADGTTLAATILSQSVPGLMMDMMLTELVFTCTNHVIGGGVNFQPFHAASFTSLPVGPIVDQFMIRFQQEILNDLTFHNQIGFALKVEMDLYGHSKLSISMNNEPYTDYVVPSFADALLVPVVTNNHQNAMNIANDFDQLLTALNGDCQGYSGGESNFGLI